MKTSSAPLITWLEMHDRPTTGACPLPEGVALVRVRPTAAHYRALYHEVGAPWAWHDRDALTNEALLAIVAHPDVHVLELREKHTLLGYAELDFRVMGQAQIAYFGLVPTAIGRRLGRPFLHAVLDAAWAPGVSRVWLHTCTLDHPRALPLYESAGFRTFSPPSSRSDSQDLNPAKGQS